MVTTTMSGASGPMGASAGPRKLLRPGGDRIVAGVGSGLAIHLGVSVRLMRLALVLLNLLGGAGVMAYVLLWVATQTGDPEPRPGAKVPPPSGRSRTPAQFLLVGAALLVAAVAIPLGLSGGASDFFASAVPLLAVGVGAVIVWTDFDGAGRGARADAGRSFWTAGGRRGLVRIIGGVALAAAGFIVVVSRGQGLSMAWDVTVATIAVLAGVGLVLAPVVLRFWHRYQDEQATRIRETERADIAAHLHDSVLQTLALIQRTDDPQRVTQLARAQERELRAWLYGGATTSSDTLAGAVTSVAHEIDDLHGVAVDLVVTGDRPLDVDGEALVRALREALLNAVRHGAPPVSAYVEVGPTLVEAFIRDHGSGFDLNEVPDDRLGVRESIFGRMQRHGGTARIRRLDEGTEVALSLPVLEESESAEPGARPGEPARTASPQAPEATSSGGPAPETPASETRAPETRASETRAPETRVPETRVPENSAPDSTVPTAQARPPQTPAPHRTESLAEVSEELFDPERAARARRATAAAAASKSTAKTASAETPSAL